MLPLEWLKSKKNTEESYSEYKREYIVKINKNYGPPIDGTGNVNDFRFMDDGIWICEQAGTPGIWFHALSHNASGLMMRGSGISTSATQTSTFQSFPSAAGPPMKIVEAEKQDEAEPELDLPEPHWDDPQHWHRQKLKRIRRG